MTTMTDAEVAEIEKSLCPPTVACIECPPVHRLIAEIRRLRAIETAALAAYSVHVWGARNDARAAAKIWDALHDTLRSSH